MQINVIGGGPAGLYAAFLLKRDNPSRRVTVYETNPRNVTWGFGVVFSDKALSFLKNDDPETFAAIASKLETWNDITLDLKGRIVVIDGVGFAAIARLTLLQILTERAESQGVELRFDSTVSDPYSKPCDLIIAADGVNSQIRSEKPREFGATLEHLNNRFAWYGTPKVFPTLTQSFRESVWGPFNAHHYRFSPQMSTFIVETTNETWVRAGLDQKSDTESRALCEEIFNDVLDGHPLVSNKSIWRTFPKVWNEQWHHGKTVLLGDALHTAHFSIGSGTRLALEDAIALAQAIRIHTAHDETDVSAALQAYQSTRKPVVRKLVDAANESADWYEQFDTRMNMPPLDFAYSYITRAGRLDDDRLSALSPNFMRSYLSFRNGETVS